MVGTGEEESDVIDINDGSLDEDTYCTSEEQMLRNIPSEEIKTSSAVGVLGTCIAEISFLESSRNQNTEQKLDYRSNSAFDSNFTLLS